MLAVSTFFGTAIATAAAAPTASSTFSKTSSGRWLRIESSRSSVDANGVPGAVFVAKPFTAAELMAKVHMLVGDNDDGED